MVADSNIIIYSAEPGQAAVRDFIVRHRPAVSAVTIVEVLGFHKLTPADRDLFEDFFAAAVVLPLTPAVIDQAVRIRQLRNLSLGDAIIAGTALAFGRALVTRNVKDFAWIDGLTVFNPLPDG